MATRPIIGINLDFAPAGRMSGAQLRLHNGYASSIAAAGGTPIFLPPCAPAEFDAALFEYMDGIVLAGSPYSLDAKNIRGESHPACDNVIPKLKWDFDVFLADHIIKYNIPVLAIANGLLTLNLRAGGEVHVHIPEDLPKAMPHKDLTGGPHRHSVRLTPRSIFDKIYGGGEIRVNSYHHQAVKTCGNRLQIAAVGLDGVIEAVESVDKEWTCLGVQWHPHSETSSALDVELFGYFVHEADRFRDGEYGVKRKLKKALK